MTLAFIPSPSQSGFHLGPLDVHVYGLMYVLAVLAAVLITRRRWRAAGEDPELVYEVAMWGFPAGLIGGRIYFLITTPSQIPDHWWGTVCDLEGRTGDLGRDRRRRRGRACTVALPAARPRRRAALHGRRCAGAAGRPAIGRIGNYFNQELFGGPYHASLGAEDLRRSTGPPATLHVRHLPAHLPLRDRLEPVAGLVPGVAGHAGARSAPPGLFALYVAGYSGFRIFEETLARRLLQPHLRPAAELLRGAGAVPDRAAVVRGLAAGLARVGGRAGRGRARERAGGGSDARAGVSAGRCGYGLGLRSDRQPPPEARASAAPAAPEGVARSAAPLTLVNDWLGGGRSGCPDVCGGLPPERGRRRPYSRRYLPAHPAKRG